MPESLPVVFAGLGAVLVLIWIVGGKFEVFGNKIPAINSPKRRVLALAGGCVSLVVSALLAITGPGHDDGKKETQLPIVQVTNNPVFNNVGNTAQDSIRASSSAQPAASYLGAWECIPPGYRPEISVAELDATRPDTTALNEGLLFMTFASKPECVRRLLDAGASVNALTMNPQHKMADGPPLHLALRQKHWDIARLLIAKRPDVNAVDTGNATALDEACSNGAPNDIVSSLKAMGAKMKMFGPALCN
ncbi:ankyrin repeat domain-containing protein [Burkholderia ubonensis]|uniref:ankyrin repeat domain-containing protein n=1 Tax=Burkholderia ubonensis TaxID=101571 RepID=UPI0009B313C7|nr:ankyrin repeat domain-containing protein [Burkholderia ubonensis]